MSILALASNTLAGSPGAGQVEYNGQFYATDSNSSRGQLERLVQGTAVASTSGTSIDFTSIPAWAKRITVMFNVVSTSGTSPLLMQIGSGSITTTGYSGNVSENTNVTYFSAGFALRFTQAAANNYSGIAILSTLGSNIWSEFANIGTNATNGSASSGGVVTLSGALDRVRITTVGGTDTFDAGSINIMYEG
jgi:hypothetical protein